MIQQRTRFSTPRLWLFAVPFSLGLAAPSGLEATPEFRYLGDLPGGGDYTIAVGVSADGKFVVGSSLSAASAPSNFEAFVWDESRGMVGLGDLPGGNFGSSAAAVSADGNVVVGASEVFRTVNNTDVRQSPFRWTRGGSMQALGPAPATNTSGTANGLSRDGFTVFGHRFYTVSCGTIFTTVEKQGFTWTATSPPGAITILPPTNRQSFAGAVNASGTLVGAESDGAEPVIAFRQRAGGARELLGTIDNNATLPRGISADGRTIVGMYQTRQGTDIFGCPGIFPFYGAFVWREGHNPPFKKLSVQTTVENNAVHAVGVSADGRVILNDAGGIYVDDQGPFDLREILAEAGVTDLRSLPAHYFRALAISESGLVIVGNTIDNDGSPFGGTRRGWRVRLSDCDGNSIPDEIEQRLFVSDASELIAAGSARFADSRDELGYGDMIQHYGRPWQVGTEQVPDDNLAQPAEFLRAALRIEGCLDGAIINSPEAATRFLTGVAFPAVQELHSFEMLLGNEAFADALDPTIGLDGVPAGDLNSVYAFKGASGVLDLLDEELALFRGRELPGSPEDWLSADNEDLYYPEYTSPTGGAVAEVALYNRLPPNAIGRNGLAYRSNYRVTSNYEAALKFPQGHGDAYGHYLTAVKASVNLLRAGPPNWPEEHLDAVAATATELDAGLETVRQLAEAGAARAQAGAHVSELTYRRDYREDPNDPRTLELFVDPEPERAWSMGEWARRGAAGAYLDWAVASHWAPTDESRTVHRDNLPELGELAGAVSAFQGRLDTAGAGLDPLGLVQNVVPFGIDPTGLGTDSNRSHYDQIRDAAMRSIENARKAFESANDLNQRLRESDKAFEDFANQLEDTKVDFDQQLIEIVGMPSADDPRDNDLDASTNDFEESQSHPDLVGFMLTDEEIAAAGMRGRQAPGQVQIGLSELKVAALRLEQAENEIDIHAALIRIQVDRIALVANVQEDRIEVISTACQQQQAVVDRVEKLEKRRKRVGLVANLGAAIVSAVSKGGNPGQLLSVAGEIVNHVWDTLGEDEFDIERERIRIQCEKEHNLQVLEDELGIDAEINELKRLWVRLPQLLVDRSIQLQLVEQAAGRLRQGINRGQLLVKNKLRLLERTEGQQLDQRWRDMAFRVFRNAALKNYRAFFDIAARYVVLATRAYAYEFEARADGEEALAGIYLERRLGSANGFDGGLQGVLTRLDAAAEAHNQNRPIRLLNELSFTFRENMLGIGNDDFPNDGRRFRAWIESNIVDRVEDIAEVRELAQISIERDYGPAIVIPFSTEVNGRNFFGRGPEPPFDSNNFQMSSNPKIVKFAIRFNGVSGKLGTDPNSGAVTVYFLPVGDSVLREFTNKPRIEDELVLPWSVVDQFLPVPPVASSGDLSRRTFNPWRSTAQSGSNFLNEIKRQKDSVAQIEQGQTGDKVIYNTQLAGRSAWNTRWLLIIPGHRFTSSSDPEVIRGKLMEFIYGSPPDPTENTGIENITLFIHAYTH